MSYIIDTDPGVDDALALAFAWGANLPIAGITTVYGNASLKQCTENALTLRATFGKYATPIYMGSEIPLKKSMRLAESHGEKGMGNFMANLGLQDRSQGTFLSLFERLQQPVTMLCLGPLTNIANLARQHPDQLQHIERIILLGGVFWGEGNVSPYAEFNIYNDPDALDILLNTKIPLVIIPADACRLVTISKEDLDNALANAALREQFHKISDVFIEYYQNNTQYGGFSGGVMYDILVIGYALYPELFTVEPHKIVVDCNDGPRRGQTSFSEKGVSASVVRTVEADKLKNAFFSAVNNLSRS